MRRPVVLLATLMVTMGTSIAQTTNSSVDPSKPYPNELPNFRFYQTAQWRTLAPLISTMKDVRRVLGNPAEASDVSAFTKPYPGDEKAKRPVFTYKMNSAWEVLVYFTRYCFHQYPRETPGDRLCSVDLVPEGRIPFDPSKLPTAFQKTHVDGADASMDEYYDGTGLRYVVYTTHTPYSSKKPGDLFRISYGRLEGNSPNTK